MEFTVEFYVSDNGRCPVREFLDELKQTDPGDFAAVLAGLAKLRHRQYHRPPLSKPAGDGLFELRHVGKLNTACFTFSGAASASSPCMAFATRPGTSRPETGRPPWSA